MHTGAGALLLCVYTEAQAHAQLLFTFYLYFIASPFVYLRIHLLPSLAVLEE